MRLPFDGSYPLTQPFGVNPQNYAKFGLQGHNGTDHALPTGTIVKAPHSGKIIETSIDPSGYGNYLKIENTTEGSVLAHLQKFFVKVGDEVKEGDTIALSDNTGNSTGPHLHFGYYRFPRDRSNGFAGFIDQTPYIGVTLPLMPTYSEKQAIIDAYQALCGVVPSSDELSFKMNELKQGKNIVVLITEICGDQRFRDKWITPNIPAPIIVPDPVVVEKLQRITAICLS